MDKKLKLGLGIGCGVLVLVVVGFMGVATWWSGRINQEYRDVRDSEKALLAATEGEDEYRPPAGGIPSPQRIEVFLAVRRDLTVWRQTLVAATEEFADDRQRQRTGGVKDLARVVNTGSDLMPVFAGFWTARNEALLAHGMGPGEYKYIHRLVYQTWLQPDRPAVASGNYPDHALNSALEPYREQLLAVFDEEVGLVELIFQQDRE